MTKMTRIILLLTLFISSLSFAAVNPIHARNIFKGNYRLIDPVSGDQMEFTIDKKGTISSRSSDLYINPKTRIDSVSNGFGPGGVSILTIMLAGGSDEQDATLVLRLFPEENEGRTKVVLIDTTYFENDGPNDSAYGEKYQDTKLYKQSAQGEWILVKNM